MKRKRTKKSKIVNFLKVFRFLSLNKALEHLGHVVKLAVLDLGNLLLLFAIIITAFASFGYLMFGAHHPDYHDMLKT